MSTIELDISDRIQYIKEINDRIFSSEITNRTNNIIFIYTPPKVGSTTLVTSLRLSGADKFNILHIHDEIMLNVLTRGANKFNVTINDIIDYNNSIGKNVYVFDVYRNPIERKISEYFEIISSFHFNTTDNKMTNYKLDLIFKRFNSIFPYIGRGDYFFDKYDINIPESFDFDKKYLLINKNNIKYIKLRLCDSDEWSKILTSILGTEIVIVKDYQTNNKIIGQLYKKFNNNYHIPYNLLDTIKECIYFNYYNSEMEISNYLNIWNNKKSDKIFIPYTIEKYNFYKELSNENQFYVNIQRDHYLDYGCICNSCCYKRNQIIQKIKNGEHVDFKIIHEEAVYEKKIQKAYTINMAYKKISNALKLLGNKRNKDFNMEKILI